MSVCTCDHAKQMQDAYSLYTFILGSFHPITTGPVYNTVLNFVHIEVVVHDLLGVSFPHSV